MNPGDVVQDRYRIERELGSGGMGAVYLARDLAKERDVALKVSAAAGRGRDELQARFEREAAIGCALGQDRGFVRAFDWGELDDGRTLYMAMDLVRGGTPLDLKSGTLPERLRRLEAAAERVARIHELGVVHRDLKPANFLVDEAGVTWLLDFGLAKLRGEEASAAEAVDLTRTGVGMGTPTFMPPEQFEDAKQVDPRGDVYALGVMLFYALTGGLPYPGNTTVEIFSRLMDARTGRSKPPRPRDVDPRVPLGLDGLCSEAIALDPQRRLPNAGAFLSGLKRARARLEEKVSSGAVPSLATIGGPPPSEPPRTPTPAPPPASAVQASLPTVALPADAGRPTPTPAVVATGGGPPDELTRALLQTLRDVAPYAGPPVLLLVLLLGGAAMLRGLVALARPAASDGTAVSPPRDPGPPRLPTPPPRPTLGPPRGADAESLYQLGLRHEQGDGVEQSYAQALRCYERAASDQHAGANFALGQMYESGTGVEEDARRAAHYYQAALRLGHAEAETRLLALQEQERWEMETEAEQRRMEAEARRREYEERIRAEREARRSRGG